MGYTAELNGKKLEIIVSPLWFHAQNLTQTATGYGRKLATEYKVKYRNRWHRVYNCCYSNIGTLYICSEKKDINISINRA